MIDIPTQAEIHQVFSIAADTPTHHGIALRVVAHAAKGLAPMIESRDRWRKRALLRRAQAIRLAGELETWKQMAEAAEKDKAQAWKDRDDARARVDELERIRQQFSGRVDTALAQMDRALSSEKPPTLNTRGPSSDDTMLKALLRRLGKLQWRLDRAERRDLAWRKLDRMHDETVEGLQKRCEELAKRINEANPANTYPAGRVATTEEMLRVAAIVAEDEAEAAGPADDCTRHIPEELVQNAEARPKDRQLLLNYSMPGHPTLLRSGPQVVECLCGALVLEARGRCDRCVKDVAV